jgi:hypothetical protein
MMENSPWLKITFGTEMLKKLLMLLILSTGANATSFSTDYTDLWWNPAENGWGVNVIQQGDTLFATLFVYSSSGSASWYVASGATFTGQQGSAPVFSGPLYQTNGPWFGGAFDPAAVGLRQVGSATFTFTSIVAGTLSYSVDGVTINKNVTRQTWRVNNLAGFYIGATIGAYSGCASNGVVEKEAIITVDHSGSEISIEISQDSASCTYSGTYQQSGRMGSISGTLLCGNGTQGTFTASELEAGVSGLTGRMTTRLGGTCTWSGKLGGLKSG